MENQSNLHYETVTPLLRETLEDLMSVELFDSFALAGGTSLSLKYGHRISVDIDLFTNTPYGSLNFKTLEAYLDARFPYFEYPDHGNIVGFGRGYYIGESENDFIKVDLYYHDEIANPYEIINGIRFVSTDDVVAMKVDVVSRKGRKKDFWDLHELLNYYSLEEMIELHRVRHEWNHERETILENFTDFELADNMPDPVCLRKKEWGLIKKTFVEHIQKKK